MRIQEIGFVANDDGEPNLASLRDDKFGEIDRAQEEIFI
jgi:hypothetical protein